MKKLIWFPRILAILFIVFISLFSLDVFTESPWLFALLIHLIPSFILILLTVIAWKHQRVGGFLFLATSLVIALFFHSLILAILPIIIGFLFLITTSPK